MSSRVSTDPQWLEGLVGLPEPWAAPGDSDPLLYGSDGSSSTEGSEGSEPSLEKRVDAQQVVRSLADLLAPPQPTAAHLTQLGAALNGCDFEALVDDLFELAPSALATSEISAGRVFEFAQWVCERTTRAVWAKLGLGLLALAGAGLDGQAQARARELAMGLGAHPDLTPFCALALQQLDPQPEIQLLKLATLARGWGREWLIDQLCASDDPAVMTWLLRDGFDSTGGTARQAVALARAAQASDALTQPGVQGATLEGAARILEAMLVGDETGDIDDYEDGGPLALAFARALRARVDEVTPLALSVVARLIGFLGEGEALAQDAARAGIEADLEYLWSQRAEAGRWTGSLRGELEALAREILEMQGTQACAEAALSAAQDRRAFERALVVADQLDIGVEGAVLARLHLDARWLELWERASMQPSSALWATAVAALPLDAIASGPELAYDFDDASEVHDALVVVVAAAFIAYGDAVAKAEDRPVLLRLWFAAMRSPLVRVRAGALAAAESLDRGALDALGFLVEELEALAVREPDADLADELRVLASRWAG